MYKGEDYFDVAPLTVGWFYFEMLLFYMRYYRPRKRVEVLPIGCLTAPKIIRFRNKPKIYILVKVLIIKVLGGGFREEKNSFKALKFLLVAPFR